MAGKIDLKEIRRTVWWLRVMGWGGTGWGPIAAVISAVLAPQYLGAWFFAGLLSMLGGALCYGLARLIDLQSAD